MQPRNEGTGVSYTTKSLSLASQRRQELLSNLTIYRDQKLAQKIKLDLSNPLLLKTKVCEKNELQRFEDNYLYLQISPSDFIPKFDDYQ